MHIAPREDWKAKAMTMAALADRSNDKSKRRSNLSALKDFLPPKEPQAAESDQQESSAPVSKEIKARRRVTMADLKGKNPIFSLQ